MNEFPAGDGQVIVVYASRADPSTARRGYSSELVAEVAADAARRAADGWMIASYDALSEEDTTGPGQYPSHMKLSETAVTVVYLKRA